MINTQLSSDYISFSLGKENDKSPFELLNNDLPEKDWTKLLILRELFENGKADLIRDEIHVPHEEICLLSASDQKLLDLPDPYPFDIRIDSDNTLDNKDFRFNWFFCANPMGSPLDAERFGSVVQIDSRSQYLLTYDQLILCNALDEYNRLPAEVKTFSNNLLEFSKVKDLSQKSAAILDKYLQNEQVLSPEKIKLNVITNDDGTIKLLPEIDIKNQDGFKKTFERNLSAKEVYTVEAEDGKRTRVAFSENQKEELKKIKQLKKVTTEELSQLAERAAETFDPEIIDLDYFSKRVIEIGIYKPKFYPFVSPYKSKWIPGFIVETSGKDKVKIKFENEKELEQFESCAAEAKKNKENQFEWRDKIIPVEGTERIIAISRRQFESPNRRIKDEQDEKVLIIYDNIENLDFKEELESMSSIEHNYSHPPNLSPNITLLKHQKEGIAWMQALNNKGISGALLADDMGLGKTLQILSFISWHNKFQNPNQSPYLIIAPVSLLENWQNEFKTFFSPSIPEMAELYGSKLDNISSKDLQTNLSFLNRNKIFLTTYETVRSKHQFTICAVNWASVFLDEAQKVKTPGTLVTNAVKALKSDFRVALTGTPVENSLMDLWCIMDFAIPGLLGSGKVFAREFHNPLRRNDTDIKELGETLRQRIGVHIKRRLKADILQDLPEKHEHKLKLEMPPAQIQRYEMEIRDSRTSMDDRGKMLKTIAALRDISDHPYIVDRELNSYSVDELIDSSAKLKLTFQILQEIQSCNEKVILFSDRKETQKLLARLVIEKFGITPSIINGETPAIVNRISSSKLSRQQAIDRFQSRKGFNAIVLSPIATGVGLNITGANNVIHYSRHWNPAKEDQATDRAYRIGQEKDVNVYYPFSVTEKFHSFDIILDEHLSKKRSLASASLFPTDQIEINPEEFFTDLTNNTDFEPAQIILSVSDIDALNPFLFEAAIALIWQNLGYKVILTSRSNDKGADVICFSDNKNILLQVKHSKNSVGDSAVGEILKAQGHYNTKYNTNFSLGIVTNAQFNLNTESIAQVNSVELFNRNFLKSQIDKMKLNLRDVNIMDRSR